jgi:glycerophosphoryl diester phosphodiesterase
VNLFLARLRSPQKRPLVIAHRGDSFHAPENTLEAARLAWAAGADAWELDVQVTSDGVPIVMHDETLLRTTDVAARFTGDARAERGFRVCDFTFEEIQSLDAGSWFIDEQGVPRSAKAFGTLRSLDPSSLGRYRSGSIRVPSLEAALEMTWELDWLVNVEIKPPRADLEMVLEAVIHTVNDREINERVIVSSFDVSFIARAAELKTARRDRPYALGILMDQVFSSVDLYLPRDVPADTLHLWHGVLGLGSDATEDPPVPHSFGPRLVERLREREAPVLVYTVNDFGPGSLARQLAALGVDAIFTDDPVGLRADLE